MPGPENTTTEATTVPTAPQPAPENLPLKGLTEKVNDAKLKFQTADENLAKLLAASQPAGLDDARNALEAATNVYKGAIQQLAAALAIIPKPGQPTTQLEAEKEEEAEAEKIEEEEEEEDAEEEEEELEIPLQEERETKEKVQKAITESFAEANQQYPELIAAQQTLAAAERDEAERTLKQAQTEPPIPQKSLEAQEKAFGNSVDDFQHLQSGIVALAVNQGVFPDPRDIALLANKLAGLEEADKGLTYLENLQSQQQPVITPQPTSTTTPPQSPLETTPQPIPGTAPQTSTPTPSPSPAPHAPTLEDRQKLIADCKESLKSLEAEQAKLLKASPEALKQVFNAAKAFDEQKANVDNLVKTDAANKTEIQKQMAILGQCLATLQNAQIYYKNSLSPEQQQKSLACQGALAAVDTRKQTLKEMKQQLNITLTNTAKLTPTEEKNQKFIKEGNFIMQIVKQTDGRLRCDFQGNKDSIDAAMQAAVNKINEKYHLEGTDKITLEYNPTTNNYHFKGTTNEQFKECMKTVKEELSKDDKGNKHEVRQMKDRDEKKEEEAAAKKAKKDAKQEEPDDTTKKAKKDDKQEKKDTDERPQSSPSPSSP